MSIGSQNETLNRADPTVRTAHCDNPSPPPILEEQTVPEQEEAPALYMLTVMGTKIVATNRDSIMLVVRMVKVHPWFSRRCNMTFKDNFPWKYEVLIAGQVQIGRLLTHVDRKRKHMSLEKFR